MKILAIMSSYRKNGNTANVVRLLEDEIRAVNRENSVPVDFETVYLGHMDLKTCRGCRVCFDRGEEKCPLQDDLLTVKEKLSATDCVILASPVYVEDVNGIMKNWIDRMAFTCHRPEYAGKVAYVLSTSGVGSSSHTLNTMSMALRTWGFTILGQSTFKAGALMNKDELRAVYRKKIDQIAGKIVDALRLNLCKKTSFVSLLTFRVQQFYYLKNQHDDDSYDLTYWREKGWLEPGCHYYYPYKVNPVKGLMIRGLSWLIAKVVLR